MKGTDNVIIDVSYSQFKVILEALRNYEGFFSDIAHATIINLKKHLQEQQDKETLVKRLFIETYFELCKEQGIKFSLRIPLLRKRCLLILKDKYRIRMKDFEWDKIVREMRFDTPDYILDFGRAMCARKGHLIRRTTSYYFITIRLKNLKKYIKEEIKVW